MSICHESVQLSGDEGRALEAKVLEAPDDVEARVRLIGHYFLHEDDEARGRRAAHIHWLIANHPEIDLSGYGVVFAEHGEAAHREAHRLWQAAVDTRADDVAVLRNAGRFFSISGDLDAAEATLLRALGLEPSNPEWRRDLGQLKTKRARASSDREERIRFARAGLDEYDAAIALEDTPLARSIVRADIAETALLADDIERAEKAATELLAEAPSFEKTWWYGNAVHYGHVVLGHLAVDRGDLASAVAELAAAGATPGSPQLDSFGPDLELAARLLRRGERAGVVAYLVACKRFWSDRASALDRWKEQIERGETPDFCPEADADPPSA